MKKLVLFLAAVFIVVAFAARATMLPPMYGTTGGAAAGVEDDVYGVGWNGDTVNAPSQNAVYDKIETLGGGGDLLADGTVPLTANWDVGAYTITGTRFISDIATGTAPFGVASTTEVANLRTATATALAANGADCAAGSYALGVDASGAATGCTDATTEIDSAISTHAALYLPLTGGTLSGQLQAFVKGATSTGGAMTVNAITIATAAGDYDLPDNCDSATFAWATLYVKDAAEAVSLTVTDTGDTIVYKGLSLDANDELDSPLAAQDSVTVICMETGLWYVTSNSGDWTDGGTAD